MGLTILLFRSNIFEIPNDNENEIEAEKDIEIEYGNLELTEESNIESHQKESFFSKFREISSEYWILLGIIVTGFSLIYSKAFLSALSDNFHSLVCS